MVIRCIGIVILLCLVTQVKAQSFEQAPKIVHMGGDVEKPHFFARCQH
jgi:hypothetical protein